MADIWQLKYTLTNSIVNRLTEIEAIRTIIEGAQISPIKIAELSRQSKIRATHYSTRIEGNRLTLDETEDVISGRRRVFLGRERDIAEVRNYWEAISRIEEWAVKAKPITEELIQRIHGIVMNGRRSRPESYRTGQNVIRDSVTGGIVYLPPEASDVPLLIHEMVLWIKQAEADKVSPILIAGLAHYQFVTIHPYYDGNGRTARLLSTFILHKCGYGLDGIFSLEEYHSRNISSYYQALDVGGHHNYYFGRASADLTDWLEYFTEIVVTVFKSVKQEAVSTSLPADSQPDIFRQLDHRARNVLTLFRHQESIVSSDVAHILGLSERMARVLLVGWVQDGWLTVANPSRRARKYKLSETLKIHLNNCPKYT